MNQWQITSNTTRSIDDGRRREVVVNTAGGSVTLLAAMPGTTEIQIVAAEVTGPPLTVSDSGDTVTVEHLRTGENAFDSLKNLFGARGSVRADLTLTVPPGTAVSVRSLQSSVEARDLSGRLRVKGGAGSVALSGLGGDVDVATAAAPVTAERTSGDLKVKTVAGSITVVRSAPATLRLNTVSGATDLDLDGPSLVTHNSVSGSFTLNAPAGQGYDVTAQSMSGHVVVDDETLSGGSSGSRGGHKSDGNRSLAVKVNTVSGNIVVSRGTGFGRPRTETGPVIVGDERAPGGIQDRVPGDATGPGASSAPNTPGATGGTHTARPAPGSVPVSDADEEPADPTRGDGS